MIYIPESNWKKLRKIKNKMLNTSCRNIFHKIDGISKKIDGREYEAYLELWKLLNKEDKDISIMFDDLKRSNAVQKLSAWKQKGIISNEQISQFTTKTQQIIEYLEFVK